MSSDDSLVVKELKERLAKANAELKEKNNANADATEITELKAEVTALINQIVAQLHLKEAKEKKKAALKDAALENRSISPALLEYYDTGIQKREAELVAITKPNVGLDGTLHELIADDSQSC
jgi:CO dehydrogenase/acetyl-CoA synthase beta subunit